MPACALLGRLPLDARIRAEADSGRPTVVAAAGHAARPRPICDLARSAAGALARRGRVIAAPHFPKIVVERAA